MRGRFVCVIVAVVATAGGSLLAQFSQPWAGTWRLSVAKSKYSPGPAPRSTTLRIEATTTGSRTVNDTVDSTGVATQTEITASFDGKEYELRGAAAPTTRAYKSANRGYEFVTRVNGKVTVTTIAVVSPDGKTLTVTQTGTDTQGRAVNNTIVYERQ